MTAEQQSQDPHDPQARAAPGVGPRPGTVTAGAILAWIASVFMVSIGAAQVIRAATADSHRVMAGMDWAVSLTGVIVIAAGLLGLLLTTLTFRGSRRSLIALTVLAVICALVPLGAVAYLLGGSDADLAAAVRALWGVAWAGAGVGLLWSGHSWFRAQRHA